MAQLNTFTVRDSATIRDAILRVIRSGLIARGVTNPNVTPGSDWYVLASAVGSQLAVTEANASVKADQLMPDTATGDDLARICQPHGLTKQAAAGSVGAVIISTSASTTVVTGSQLVDGSGLAYQVTVGGTYSDQSSIPVAAVATGTQTNHAAGDTLRWVSAPAFAASTVTVGPGGFVNGIDEEDDEALRARLFAFLQNPPASGNAQDTAEIAEASTASVQKAFVYPAIQGPSTVHVAVTAAPTSSNKSRDIATATMSATVIPYVQGLLPEHAYSVITTVANVDADVAFGLSLPEAPTASPPGPGGGWVDGTPWPTPDASTTFKCTVTGVTSNNQFTVDATTSPNPGVSHISWFSPFNDQLYNALVVSVSGTSGAYTITTDQPLVGIATGCFIWPQCQNGQNYVNAVLAQFALMGPGEKTTNASALIRGFRHPRPAAGWPSDLGAHLQRAISTAQTEVLDVQFMYRTDGATTLNGNSGRILPQTPGALTGAPNIYRPRHLAFYRNP